MGSKRTPRGPFSPTVAQNNRRVVELNYGLVSLQLTQFIILGGLTIEPLTTSTSSVSEVNIQYHFVTQTPGVGVIPSLSRVHYAGVLYAPYSFDRPQVAHNQSINRFPIGPRQQAFLRRRKETRTLFSSTQQTW